MVSGTPLTDGGRARLGPWVPDPPVPWAAPRDPPESPPGSAVLQVITIFSLVEVVLRAEAAALKYSAILKRPGTEDLLGLQDKEECDSDHDYEQED